MTSASFRPYLRLVPFCKHLPPARQLAIASHLVRKQLAAGQELDLRGCHAQALCLLIRGRLTVQIWSRRHGTMTRRLRPGRCAGQRLVLGWWEAQHTTLTAGPDGADVLLLWQRDLAQVVPFALLISLVRAISGTLWRCGRVPASQPALLGMLLALISFLASVLVTPPGRALQADWSYLWYSTRTPSTENVQIERLQHIIDLSPDHALALVELGNLLAQRGDTDAAAQQYQAIDDRHAAAVNNRSVLLLQNGDLDAALEGLLRSSHLDADIAIAHQNLGIVYLQMGDRDAAMRSFKEALRIDPDLTIARYHLGMDYLSQHDFIRAGTAFERILEIDPACGPAYVGLGLVHREIGDLPRAAIEFEQGAQLTTNPLTALFYLGKTQREIGQLGAAQGTWARLLVLEPPPALADRVRIMVNDTMTIDGKEAPVDSGP